MKTVSARAGEITIRAAINQPKATMPAISRVRQIGRKETALKTIRKTSVATSPRRIEKKDFTALERTAEA